jgi:hypothetical protein
MKTFNVLTLIALGLAPVANAQECTTSTTTTTHCTGSAAQLAAPGPEAPPAYPQPTPQPYPSVYQPQLYLPPPAFRSSHVEVRPNTGLMITGAALFGALYLVNAGTAYVSGEGTVAIPVVGPLIYGQNRDDAGLKLFMALDFAAQTTGVVLFAIGALTHHKVTVLDKVAMVPTASSVGAGLSAVGRF